MRDLIERICAGQHLERETTRKIFARLIAGELSEIEIAALLVALKAKGESPEEIAGAAEALRAAALPFDTGGVPVADSCGTGGDHVGTVNVSTAVALLAAEMGLHVAKHGNRSVSSRCGSADVLEHCGVKIDTSSEVAARCLRELRICFLFAPQYHSGVRYAMPVRRALGVRTIFNMVGPLANPAAPKWQLVGVYQPELCEPMARTLGLLGCEAALVVHGSGLDEIALHGPTTAALLRDGGVEPLQIDPEQLGIPRQPLDQLRGGDATHNAAWLRKLLAGKGLQSHVQAVALNTGALLWIAGRAEDLGQGFAAAQDALRSGTTAQRLQRWAELSHGA